MRVKLKRNCRGGRRFRFMILGILLLSSLRASASSIYVDCEAGQSLARTLARMDHSIPATITVRGTCTEYVTVEGFSNLTLQGSRGATIQQPATNPQTAPYVLSIRDSRSIIVSGLTVRSLPSVFSGIGIGAGSANVLLKDVSTEGSWGVVVYEASQAWLVRMTVTLTSGFAAIAAFDKSDVHIVDGLLERPLNSAFNAGLLVSSGHITVQGMTIRDMQQGININAGGSVDLVDFDSTATGSDVRIENPSGTNVIGAIVSDSSSLNVESATLVIDHAGLPGQADSGGILVTNGSTLGAGPNLAILNSRSQGIIVSNNSHAQLAGSMITGSSHGGLDVVNDSTAGIDPSHPLTVISGNGTDLFCDSRSRITGSANIANATVVHCANLLAGSYENLP